MMKKLIKISALLFVFFMYSGSGFAIQTSKIKSRISSSELDKTATIAISVKKIDGTSVFEQNGDKLMHPASAVKIFTLYPALNILGYDYMFGTEFYKDGQNNLYIKLGADPMLTASMLKGAISQIADAGNKTFKNIFIDDGILDKQEFAQGWMWDDDINYYTPKVSAYNMDGNVININMTKNSDGSVTTSTKPAYPTAVVNKGLKAASGNYIDIKRYNWLNPDVVEISGGIKDSKTIKIPVSNMRKYFIYNLEKALKDNRIEVSGTMFASKTLPSDAVMLTSVTNPVSNVLRGILQKSNNLYAETIYKVAGAKAYNSTGSDYLGGEMFKAFYNKNGIKTDGIIIKDGCGVSRNNLFSANWMTDALSMLYKQSEFEKFKDNMAQPGDGTLSSRLHDLRGNAWLKTGSLSNVSAIAGYVKSEDGNIYALAILTQNFNEDPKTVKNFEDEIIKLIYSK